MATRFQRNVALTISVVLAMTVAVAVITQRGPKGNADAVETNVFTTSFHRVWASQETHGQQPLPSSFAHELERIEAEPDVVIRDERLDRVLAGINSSSASNLLEAVQNEPRTRTSQAAELRLIRQWADSDPAAAANWLAGTSPEIRMDAISQVAVAWAQRDCAAATAWAQSLEGPERENARAHIAGEAVRTDPKLAFELARELPMSERRNNILFHAAAEVTATGKSEVALAFANNETDESLRERLLSVIFASLADTDPLSAATAAAERLTARRPQDNAAMSIVQRWLQTDPGAASAWVDSFPDGDLRRTARLTFEQHR